MNSAVHTIDEAVLRQWFADCGDVTCISHPIGKEEHDRKVWLIYSSGLIDSSKITQFVLPPLQNIPLGIDKTIPLLPIELVALRPDQYNEQEIGTLVFSGKLVLFFEANAKLYFFDIADIPGRPPEESNLEVSIRGPKDGFTDNIEQNLALIRKRIRSTTLSCELWELGTRSQTKTALLYLKDVAEDEMIDDIRNRLNHISIDSILTLAHLEDVLNDSHVPLFPLLAHSGRPDFIAQCLINGRFVLLLDGNPTASVAPATLPLLLKSPEDAHFPFLSVAFARFLRLIGFFISIFLPGFFISLNNFHQDQLPFPLLATITNSRLGLPFSAAQEMLFILILMEIFREAGARLPTSIGQTLTVVGGLIIGDAAIRAGLISPTMVVVTAITIVASSTIGNQTLGGVLATLRFTVFFISAILGLFGFFMCFLLLLIYLGSMNSFGVPYLSPIAPLNIRDLPKALFKLPRKEYRRRPAALNTKEPDKGEDQQ
ncbi:spore germination protein [Paenibacillus daejeonensis]|uniref:spore germination protein n=1 Tax=Paenibacillus daejeonensis TaxID=135193 RepID=UPI00035C8BDB|nr:spore germination protein [Paenibacillus daejeonensis]